MEEVISRWGDDVALRVADLPVRRGRLLHPGDMAQTDYNGEGRIVRVRIVERDETRRHGVSQSGILFRVDPPLQHGTSWSWYDADWFEPVNSEL